MADADASRVITGYALRFLERSLDLGGFVEQFAPSSMNRTFAERVDVRALAGHDPARLLGRVSANTLRLSADSHGLRFELDTPATSDGHDVLELVRRRDLTGASFAFSVVGAGEEWDFSGSVPLRTIIDARLREISLVAWPAYHTNASVRVGLRSIGYNKRLFLERWHRTRLAR